MEHYLDLWNAVFSICRFKRKLNQSRKLQITRIEAGGLDFWEEDVRFLKWKYGIDKSIPNKHPEIESDLIKATWQALAHLKERDRDIIQRRFGIGYEPQTLSEIAAAYSMSSRERIRQIEIRVLGELKSLHISYYAQKCLATAGFLEMPNEMLDPVKLAEIKTLTAGAYRFSDQELENMPCEILPFRSYRAKIRNALLNENICNLLDLKKQTRERLLRIPNLGEKSVAEIARAAAEFGISL